jgi:hypothetical protein
MNTNQPRAGVSGAEESFDFRNVPEVQGFLDFVGASFGARVRTSCESLLSDRTNGRGVDELKKPSVLESLFDETLDNVFKSEHRLAVAAAAMPFTSD